MNKQLKPLPTDNRDMAAEIAVLANAAAHKRPDADPARLNAIAVLLAVRLQRPDPLALARWPDAVLIAAVAAADEAGCEPLLSAASAEMAKRLPADADAA